MESHVDQVSQADIVDMRTVPLQEQRLNTIMKWVGAHTAMGKYEKPSHFIRTCKLIV